MTKEKPLLVKIFIDGQNFYNRILDFDLDLQQIDYPLFFKTILDSIRPKFSPTNSIVLLKSEWL